MDKRLLNGNLLVISKNKFEEEDFVLAVVLRDKDSNNLKKKQIQVCLLDNSYENFMKFIEWNNSDTILDMYESKAFYESYRYILKRIQNMDTRSLPFMDIFVNFRNNPGVLIPDNTTTDAVFNYNLKNFYVYNDISFPKELTKILDDSQLKALKIGLRNKVAIIQGPPGTGKTYVGSFLTKILIQNSNSPILVVCYTNHALDQFLKIISKYEKNIIRIGGQCKDEELQIFTLQNKRKNGLSNNLKAKRIEIRDAADHLTEFAASFSRINILDYYTCEYNYPEFINKLIDDFEICMNCLYENYEERLVNGLNKEYVYISWIKPSLLHKVTYDIQQNSDYEISKFLEKIKKNLKIENSDSNAEENENYLDDTFEDEENNLENLQRVENNIDEEDEDAYFININKQNHKEEDLQLQEDKIFNLNRINSNDINTLISSDTNLWTLSESVRLSIIFELKKQFTLNNLENLQPKITTFTNLLEQKREIENLQDLHIIKQAKIVGMTTTGAAKYSTFLEQANFEIVIIEEAAEVLESHITSLLTKNTKRIILIGDHQQLRPNPYNYEICKKFNFDVSLFERLINNEVPYVSLEFQRRMRPEFADFVRLIYNKTSYNDHLTVKNQPLVNGFSSNIFFLNHKHFEESNEGLASKSNKFEAEFIVGLANYIIQQGYAGSQITILTLYIAQVILIKTILKNRKIIIRVVSVDNYQGEENDFILLSLVRSNKENQIGFLKSFNRVCVAFSRAKKGFYIFGNFDCIIKGQEHKNKEIKQEKFLWTEIFKLAQEKNVMKEQFEFICQRHKTKNIVKKPDDFRFIPEGGCKEICRDRLECGHACEFHCHNFAHEKKHCRKPCQKILECGHKCTKTCDLNCEKCLTLVVKKLRCGHFEKQKCHIEIEKITCYKQVEILLPKCGHTAYVDCCKSDSLAVENFKCQTKVEVVLNCSHIQTKLCYQSIDGINCTYPCGKLLDCNDICKGTCHECINGTLHIPCNNRCNKILPCSHECKTDCSQPCICNKYCELECVHGRCTLKCSQPCIPCAEPCKVKCKHGSCTNLCGQKCNFRCDKRCIKRMKCGHICRGLCGEVCPKICKFCDPDNDAFQVFFGNEDEDDALFYKLDCGHIFELKGLDNYLELNSDTYYIKAKTCLKCIKPITIFQGKRYKSRIIETYDLIQKLKVVILKSYGDYNSLFSETMKIVNDPPINSYLKKFESSCIKKLFECTLSLKTKDKIPQLLSNYNLCTMAKKIIDVESLIHHEKDSNNLSVIDRYIIKESINTSSNDPFIKNLISHFKKVSEYFSKPAAYSQQFINRLKRKVDSLWLAREVYKDAGHKNYLIYFTKTNYLLEQNLIDKFSKIFIINEAEIKEVMSISGGRWYQCPNGHLYSVGECGQPTEQSTCPNCNNIIGGIDHRLNSDNREFTGFNGNNNI